MRHVFRMGELKNSQFFDKLKEEHTWKNKTYMGR